MNTEEIMKRDAENVMGTYARYDLCLEKGNGATCYSPEGKKYIDFSSGIGVNSLGFCDKGWVEAITKQANMIQHISNLFYTYPCSKLAEMVLKRTSMQKMFFANSGAEANEGAIKTARKYSFQKYGENRYEIITLVNSFHGRTMATITATGQEDYHKYFAPFVKGFSYAKANDIDDVKSKINEKTCAIMLELVQGEGGVVPLEKDFVSNISKICKEKDIIFIVDEVQTGIGRTGTLFAYEQFSIEPDLVTLAKGLGAGLPIGGILFGKKTCDVLKPGDHGTTFGGNPITCAGGIEVLKRIDDAFLKEVSEKGAYIKDAVEKMDNVVSVTGMGMMLGIEVKNKTAKDVVKTCIENGLIPLTAKEKIRLLPPLTITYEELDEGLEILKKALSN
ncbi:aspartate aminotransferase family protein [Anaerovorax odorimutans]|uniref:aspartate aminotransferase family protein n=1 Tax=Anaerovorax odorimutans TaxID=109327 RepID=UPI0003F8915C|nr:aspartate aminotransferase family protein [Anaerovorax odorimutans]